jgi:molybdopterin-guanine dinucleotide biosynthesis protein A
MGHALVILCGGKSVRMGSDKALLPFGDFCLIEYLVKRFSPFFDAVYLSVKKKGDYAHLNLPVTEIPDIYPNAGPMSGIFSGLSMINEDAAFFMSVDTPFLEPETAIALLEALDDADICTIRGKANFLETATGAYSKNCITSIGKSLLLHQLSFQLLREKCTTKYLTEKAIANHTKTPVEFQFYNLDTRADYYHALRMLSGIKSPESSKALLAYFNDREDLFLHKVPTVTFCARPGTLMAPFIEKLIPLLEKDGLTVAYLTREESSVIFHNIKNNPTPELLTAALNASDILLLENFGEDSPNPVEILRKNWSEAPSREPSDLTAVISDFAYENDAVPCFDFNKPKPFASFLQELLLR